MRNLKRLLAMTLTMLMVVGCFSLSASALEFDDVYDYTEAIDSLSDLGVIWGYEDGTFGPDISVERWHMALWIAKMETGKVSTPEYLNVWRAEENYTPFNDINVDQAIGAISYAANRGIVIGTSDVTFAPTAGIKFQEALTMVVRALGYGSKTMDAGYPWKYINEAVKLGLDAGLEGLGYQDVLTRAETAQLLYNALYTVNDDGGTYASDVFNLNYQTVVITGTNNYKIVNNESVIKTGFVAFNLLKADGTIDENVTYYLPATDFIDEEDNADDFVGASFKVTTKDNFKTLDTAALADYDVFDQDDVVGKGTSTVPSTLVDIDGVTYQVVDSYSSLHNTQGIKGNYPEIIVYQTNTAATAETGIFKKDANYNILNAAGNVVAYYRPDITLSYARPYVAIPAEGVYIPFRNDDEIKAAGGLELATSVNNYTVITNTWSLAANNKYADFVAYDDNGDGVYDRGFYTYHEFGRFAQDPAPATTFSTQTHSNIAVAKFFDADGEVIAAPTGAFIRYSYDPLSKYLTVYETYPYATGLVTSVVGQASITIGGTTYAVGIGNFRGATANLSGVNNSIIGKQSNFVLVDGKVVRVFDAAIGGSYIAFDKIVGMTNAGYATALVYNQTRNASVITIATINGYSYQQYILWNGQLGNITGTLEQGDLFKGTTDASGFWHLVTVDEYTYYADYIAYPSTPVDGSAVIEFANGIANLTESDLYYKSGALKPFSQFTTNGNTVYIAYNADNGTFTTRQGIPDTGAEIYVDGAMFVVMAADGITASFVYVYDGVLTGEYRAPAWYSYGYDTVIYVDDSTSATQVTNDLGSTGALLGYTWKYSNVVDMVKGGWTTVYTLYNAQLTPGKYYTVSNGYVQNEVVPGADNSPIQIGYLTQVGTFFSDIEFAGGPDIERSAFTFLYKLTGTAVTRSAVDGSIVNMMGNADEVTDINTANTYVPVYFYNGAIPGNRVLLYRDLKTVTALPNGDGPFTDSVADTAVGAGGASRNYYKINEAAYAAITSYGTDVSGENNIYVDRSWMKVYKVDGTTKTEIDFSGVGLWTSLYVNEYGQPTYTLGLGYVPPFTLDDVNLVGNYTFNFMVNGVIYSLLLEDVML